MSCSVSIYFVLASSELFHVIVVKLGEGVVVPVVFSYAYIKLLICKRSTPCLRLGEVICKH